VGLGGNPTVTALLTTRGEDVGSTLTVLRYLGQEQVASVHAVEVARAWQEQLTEQATAAADDANKTAIEATKARDAANAAVQQQRDLLAAADSELASTTKQLGVAQLYSGDLQPGSNTNAVTGKVGSCKGGQVEIYSNGKIPLSALCPLWASSSQYLRADASYAFNRLSHAYAQEFGVKPCITDSYRTYAQQVALYAAKPGLAAKPGTSNHGWGTALDLCGGIQNYGTKQYRWMLINAPLYGWFHPYWARQGGGREEPWHWEFGG
jgi:hypothetical protein